jgi:hypothetical protein
MAFRAHLPPAWRVTRRGLMTMLAAVLASPLAGCGVLPRKSYRFRMTVEVETPEGLTSGSSVYQVTAGNTPALLPDEHKRDWAVKGEAALIDLPDGKLLAVILRTRNGSRPDLARMSMAAFDPAFRNDIVESAGRIISGHDALTKAEVGPADYPILLLFEDPTKAASAKQVDPIDPGSSERFPYKLHRISVERTDDAVTSGIVRKLTWLPRQHGALLQVPFSQYPPAGTPLPAAANLTEHDFSQGMVR